MVLLRWIIPFSFYVLLESTVFPTKVPHLMPPIFPLTPEMALHQHFKRKLLQNFSPYFERKYLHHKLLKGKNILLVPIPRKNKLVLPLWPVKIKTERTIQPQVTPPLQSILGLPMAGTFVTQEPAVRQLIPRGIALNTNDNRIDRNNNYNFPNGMRMGREQNMVYIENRNNNNNFDNFNNNNNNLNNLNSNNNIQISDNFNYNNQRNNNNRNTAPGVDFIGRTVRGRRAFESFDNRNLINDIINSNFGPIYRAAPSPTETGVPGDVREIQNFNRNLNIDSSGLPLNTNLNNRFDPAYFITASDGRYTTDSRETKSGALDGRQGPDVVLEVNLDQTVNFESGVSSLSPNIAESGISYKVLDAPAVVPGERISAHGNVLKSGATSDTFTGDISAAALPIPPTARASDILSNRVSDVPVLLPGDGQNLQGPNIVSGNIASVGGTSAGISLIGAPAEFLDTVSNAPVMLPFDRSLQGSVLDSTETSGITSLGGTTVGARPITAPLEESDVVPESPLLVSGDRSLSGPVIDSRTTSDITPINGINAGGELITAPSGALSVVPDPPILLQGNGGNIQSSAVDSGSTSDIAPTDAAFLGSFEQITGSGPITDVPQRMSPSVITYGNEYWNGADNFYNENTFNSYQRIGPKDIFRQPLSGRTLDFRDMGSQLPTATEGDWITRTQPESGPVIEISLNGDFPTTENTGGDFISAADGNVSVDRNAIASLDAAGKDPNSGSAADASAGQAVVDPSAGSPVDPNVGAAVDMTIDSLRHPNAGPAIDISAGNAIPDLSAGSVVDTNAVSEVNSIGASASELNSTAGAPFGTINLIELPPGSAGNQLFPNGLGSTGIKVFEVTSDMGGIPAGSTVHDLGPVDVFSVGKIGDPPGNNGNIQIVVLDGAQADSLVGDGSQSPGQKVATNDPVGSASPVQIPAQSIDMSGVGTLGEPVGSIPAGNSEVLGVFSLPSGVDLPSIPQSVSAIPEGIQRAAAEAAEAPRPTRAH